MWGRPGMRTMRERMVVARNSRPPGHWRSQKSCPMGPSRRDGTGGLPLRSFGEAVPVRRLDRLQGSEEENRERSAPLP